MTAIEMKIVSRWVDGMGGTMLLADSRKNMFAPEHFVELVCQPIPHWQQKQKQKQEQKQEQKQQQQQQPMVSNDSCYTIISICLLGNIY